MALSFLGGPLFLTNLFGGELIFGLHPAADKFSTVARWVAPKGHAHSIWFVFVGIAATLAVDLIVFGMITRRIDARHAVEGGVLT